MTVFWFQEASRVLHSNACLPVVRDGLTMFFDVSLDILLTPAPQPLGNINPSRDIGNDRKTSDKTLSPYAKRSGMIALGPCRCVYGDETLSPKRRKSRSMYLLTPDFCYGRWKRRSSLRLRQWPLGIDQFICAGNKKSGAVFSFTGKRVRPSLHSSRRVYDLHQETLSLQECHWKSDIPRMVQESKTFHLRRGVYS